MNATIISCGLTADQERYLHVAFVYSVLGFAMSALTCLGHCVKVCVGKPRDVLPYNS